MAKDVLIIDADGGAPIVEALQSRGLSVRVTDDGKRGIELAQEQRPDAIVLCAELPSMSGYSICAKLRKDPLLRDIPLLFTSSEATAATFEHHKKLKVRADEYLSKPIDAGHFIDVLGRHVLVDDFEVEEEIAISEEFSIDEPETAHDEGFDVDAAIADAAASLDDAMEAMSEASEEVGLPEPADEPSKPPPSRPQSWAAPSTRPESPPPSRPSSAPPVRSSPQPAPAQLDGAYPAELSETGETTELRATIQRLEAELAELRSRRVPSQAPGGSRDTLAIKKELNAKDRELFELRNQLHEKDRIILELRDEETELESRVVQLEEERGDFDQRLQTTQRQLEQTAQQRDDAESEAERARQAEEEAAGRRADAERELESAKKVGQQASERAERLQNEKSAAEAEAQQLRMHSEELKTQLERANGRIEDLEHRRDALIAERDDLQGRLSNAQEEMHAADSKRRRLEESAKKARHALQIAHKMLGELDGAEEDTASDHPARA